MFGWPALRRRVEIQYLGASGSVLHLTPCRSALRSPMRQPLRVGRSSLMYRRYEAGTNVFNVAADYLERLSDVRSLSAEASRPPLASWEHLLTNHSTSSCSRLMR